MSKNRNDQKAERREEAQARQAAHSKLTPTQKLAKLDLMGYAAKRERAQLQRLIDAK